MYANNSKNLWAIWNSKNRHMLSNIHKAEDFAQQFCNNFTDKTENDLSKIYEFMKHVETRANDLLSSSFSAEEIEKAVSALNLTTALDSEKFCTVCIVCTSSYFCIFINIFITLMHSYVPNKIGLSIVLLTLKNEVKSTSDITNHRPISTMPVISKIF